MTRSVSTVARGVVALALVAALTPAGALAQEGGRDRLWISGGLGGGWSFSDALGWISPQARLGHRFADRALIGVEGLGLVWPELGTWAGRGNLMVIALAYPQEGRPYFARVGVGWAHARLTTSMLDATVTGTERGIGAVAGVGGVARLGDSPNGLTYALDLMLQSFDSRTYDTREATVVLTFGYSRGGLPRLAGR